jgi:hypothetical protein
VWPVSCTVPHSLHHLILREMCFGTLRIFYSRSSKHRQNSAKKPKHMKTDAVQTLVSGIPDESINEARLSNDAPQPAPKTPNGPSSRSVDKVETSGSEAIPKATGGMVVDTRVFHVQDGSRREGPADIPNKHEVVIGNDGKSCCCDCSLQRSLTVLRVHRRYFNREPRHSGRCTHANSKSHRSDLRHFFT